MPWVVKRNGPLRTVWPWYKPWSKRFLDAHESELSYVRCYCCGRWEIVYKYVCGTCSYWYWRVQQERKRRYMQAVGRPPGPPGYPFAERFTSAMRCAYFNLDWVHDTWRYHSAVRRAQVAAAQEAAEPAAPPPAPPAPSIQGRGPLAGMIHA